MNVDDPADPANAGIQFFVGDATNTAYYKVSGKTSYPGGWYNLVVDLSRTADTGTKPTDMLCTKVGLRVNMIVAPKNVDNVWIDNLIRCDGLSCDSDTQFGFQDIFDKDDATTGGWGVIRKIAGVFYLTGKIQIGVGSGSTSVDFKATSQAVIFEDRKVNSALYGINAVGNSGVTKLQLGDESGGAGISGCIIRTQSVTQTPKFTIGASSLGVNDVFKLYGCGFLDAGITTLPTATANREVLNCNFEKGGEIIISTCKVRNCNFISSDGSAILMSSISHDTTNCNFINCPEGVKLDTYNAAAYPFNALIFTGTTSHVNNTSGSTLTVGNSNGSNASTYTGTLVNFTGSVVLTMTIKNEAGSPIFEALAYIDPTDESPFIMNKLTDTGGVASETYTGSPVTDTRWRVRKYGYKDYTMDTTFPLTGLSITPILATDPQATT